MDILNSTFVQLLLLLIFIGIAYLLSDKYGLRKALPATLILVLSVASYILLSIPPTPEPELTPELKQQIRAEQMIVAEWYTLYKQDLTQVDLYWQQYHKNLTAFTNDEISIQNFLTQLTELETKLLPYTQKYATPTLPDKLRPGTADTITKIITKTQTFIGSEYQVVQKSITLASEINFQHKTHQEQVHDLEKIMVLGSPSILNIAAEISSLRDNLIVPGENE